MPGFGKMRARERASREREACAGTPRLRFRRQQIERPTFDFRAAHRIDPSGCWCFSEVGHGWPVSDCTAEALLGLLHGRPESLGRDAAARAARFILRCQNTDGGFGSYEPSKTRAPLEWMNPAEMFGRCMTERSYVECTASCLMALREVPQRYPSVLRRPLSNAIEDARRFLLDSQNRDGTWEAAWGVRYIYATMFGVRGLLAAGVPRQDPRIRKACEWLLAHQRADGGWGERQPSAALPEYVEADASLSVQTAWALIALAEAGEPDGRALARAAAYLEAARGSTESSQRDFRYNAAISLYEAGQYREAADLLEENGITVNKNGVPNDPRSFVETSGIRIGTAAETTRGHDEVWFRELSNRIADILQ